jgi:hypothetical protein
MSPAAWALRLATPLPHPTAGPTLRACALVNRSRWAAST